ncbi:hypothetical protein OM076_34360 [Solirubrobacter ginsenosidimutans]|uniref:Uncharacterized protein n=1 Tax=Solirubrobacter ginsenosidimutans TaxID=490573 RepID=A0A9X3S464_9ACTN|nr:hypothetical protein [Solirubrobacter ginsenosidimutans]MDA0165404.1 hypothetical protein [Solirubrobacter ginsenosidimutans]
MDPATIALAAASLIATKIAERIGEGTGDGLAGVATRLLKRVKDRFAGDAEVDEALTRLEQKPGSEARAQEVAEVLEPRLEANPQFAKELQELLDEAEKREGNTQIVTNILGNARVNKVTNIGVAGDVTIN